jgi:hypothetical protein
MMDSLLTPILNSVHLSLSLYLNHGNASGLPFPFCGIVHFSRKTIKHFIGQRDFASLTRHLPCG